MILFRWVGELLDRSQVFSLRIALNVRSAVAEQIGIVKYHFSSLFSCGMVCLAAGKAFIRSQMLEILVHSVTIDDDDTLYILTNV